MQSLEIYILYIFYTVSLSQVFSYMLNNETNKAKLEPIQFNSL